MTSSKTKLPTADCLVACRLNLYYRVAAQPEPLPEPCKHCHCRHAQLLLIYSALFGFLLHNYKIAAFLLLVLFECWHAEYESYSVIALHAQILTSTEA